MDAERLSRKLAMSDLCMCKARPLSECPGEWEPGCDLGNNEKFVRVSRPQPAGRQEPGVREALAELIACKDLRDRFEGRSVVEVSDVLYSDYLRRQPLAWEAARRALSNVETAPQADTPASEPAPSLRADLLDLREVALEAAQEALEALTAKFEAVKLQAQLWKQEARTANATIAEIYQIVTGSTGEPGNWNGAEPVRAALQPKTAPQADGRGAVETPSDAARLDWFTANPRRVGFSSGYRGAPDSWMYRTERGAHIDAPDLRAAIDAAMGASPNGVRPAAMTTEGEE